jgi:sugar phosphate isomerase/epimerase
MVKLSAVMRLREGETWDGLARRAAGLGFRGVSLPFDPRWTEQDLLAIRQAFDEAGVGIVELACRCNLLTPRDEESRRNLQQLSAALGAGALLNCDHAVIRAGSRHPDPNQPFAPHPDNGADATWDLLVQRIWALLDGVEDLGVCLCLRPAPTTPLNTLDSLAELMADTATFRVRVALDPAAILTPAGAQDSRRALAEIFSVLADKIAVAHATDVRLIEAAPEPEVEAAPLGEGVLDYETYVKLLAALQLDTPLVVEAQESGDAYRACHDLLAAAAKQAGVGPHQAE